MLVIHPQSWRVQCRVRGFTIIELSIALVIAAFLVAMGAPAFTIWLTDTQIRTVAESIQDGLQIARNEALRRNTFVEFQIQTDTGWSIIAKRPGTADESVQSRPAKEGVKVAIVVTMTPAGASVVRFDSFGRVATVDANGNPLTPVSRVDVSAALAGTRPLSVQMGAGGRVRMCDPAISLTSDDPRKCES